MVVYVADNLDTGERIMSHNEKAFHNVVSETFGPRFLEAVEVYVFDLNDADILAEVHTHANEGSYLAMAVLNYVKEKGGSV